MIRRHIDAFTCTLISHPLHLPKMGKLKSSHLQNLTGRLSNLIFYEVNGQQLVRTQPSHYRDAKSELQLMHRQRFTLVQQFLKCFRPLINSYYNQVAPGKTAYGEALSWHLHHALTGNYPNVTIDPAHAQITRGSLPPLVVTSMRRENNALQLAWIDEKLPPGRAQDLLQIIGLPMGSRLAVVLDEVATRGQQTATYAIHWPVGQTDAWAFYVDVKTGNVSNSVYLGQV